jgi:signal transduction histidine kinase
VTGYQDATREALSNIREILYELRGDEEDLGSEFVARVRRLLERFEEKTGISASLSVSASWPSRLAVQAAVNLYRVLEEALNNVRMHSGANAVAVSFRMEEGDLAVVSVTDDGVGVGPLMGERTGLGMLGMRERALLLGGELSIEPVRPHGMALTAVIPKERLL